MHTLTQIIIHTLIQIIMHRLIQRWSCTHSRLHAHIKVGDNYSLFFSCLNYFMVGRCHGLAGSAFHTDRVVQRKLQWQNISVLFLGWHESCQMSVRVSAVVRVVYLSADADTYVSRTWQWALVKGRRLRGRLSARYYFATTGGISPYVLKIHT